MVKKQRDLRDLVASWKGTANTLVLDLSDLIDGRFEGLPKPSVRTVRLWRTKGLLSASGKRSFTGRQLIESLAVLQLQARGWSLAAIADLVPGLDNIALVSRVLGESDVDWGTPAAKGSATANEHSRRAVDAAEVGVVLLAQGILRIYDRTLSGREIVRQDDSLPPELHQAMSQLGRMYIEDGKEDRAGSVHDLLDRCRFSLNHATWGLRVFSENLFRFRDAVLVDPDLRVPTQDAIAVAASGGLGMDDIIENQLHSRLREAADRLGPTRNAAYTAIREFIGRRSLATEAEIHDWFERHKITAVQGIIDDLYDRVPESWLIGGRALRCAWCGTLLRPHPDRSRFPDGKCPLRQCAVKQDAQASDRLEPTGLLVCRPQVLMYWCGPAVDELQLYDVARNNMLDPELYPEGDRCDISIGRDRIGIDVKCYTSPVSLALRLNTSLGGLTGYRRRIIAIPDDLATRPGYMDSLQSSLDKPDDSPNLEIRSIGALLSLFTEGKIHA